MSGAMSAYYNETDPYTAQWLRNLIAAGHIAAGEVDERSILDVSPDDLAGFIQCHFFAGIGVWSHALRRGAWPDERPVWTGSCPCQPFSVAGMGSGMDDQRHLWPFWFHLIEQRRPPVVFGEQVEAAIRHGWLDLVQADMEGSGYAFAAAGIPAAGIGAPHIRQRLYFVAANADGRDAGAEGLQRGGQHGLFEEVRGVGRVGDANNPGLERFGRGHQTEAGRDAAIRSVAEAGQSGGLVDALQLGREEGNEGYAEDERILPAVGTPVRGDANHASPTDGFWRDADWLLCRDGKWRAVEPGTFPLAHGAPARVGRLRAYGNAIVPQVAAEFVSAFLECRP